MNIVHSFFNYLWPDLAVPNPASFEEYDLRVQLKELLGHDPKKWGLYEKYFSVYSTGQLPLDGATIQKLEQVLQRAELGKETAQQWDKVLLDSMGSHQLIGDEKLLVSALSAQFAFDRELLKLKKIDLYKNLAYGKVQNELDILKRGGKESHPILEEIQKKADAFGMKFEEQLALSIQMREELLVELHSRIEKIDQQLLLTEERSSVQGSLHSLVEVSAPKLHSTLKNHYIIALGDPILDRSAKFLIIKRPNGISDSDWMHIVKTKLSNKALVEGGVFQKQPNQVTHFGIKIGSKKMLIEVCYENVSDVLRLHENRDIHMKTRRKIVDQTHYGRENFVEKSGVSSRVKTSVREALHNNWSKDREATAGPDCHQAIIVNRRLISHILHGRGGDLAQKECQNLGEYFDALPQNDAAALEGSYNQDPRFQQAFRLQKQAHENLKINQYGAGVILPYLEEGTKAPYAWKKDRVRAPLLAQDLFESYMGWRKHLSLFLKELKKDKNKKVAGEIGGQTIHELSTLSKTLQHFINESPHRALQKVLLARKRIIEKHDGIQAELIQRRDKKARLYKNKPEVLSEKLARNYALQVKYNKAKAADLDEVWVKWRKNKSSLQIDEILNSTFDAVQKRLAAFTQNLVLVNVLFSSPYRQKEIEDSMKKSPELLDLYRKAIPPIWQNKVKIQTLVQGELMRGTELSPLWLKQADLMELADQELIKNEFIRSRLANLSV